MKNRKSILVGLAVFAGLWHGAVRPVYGQQANFQIAPAPIAYPYFEPQRVDLKITGMYASLSATNISLKGGGALFTGRKAINEKVAIDGQIGMFGLSGDMPGFALPFYYSGVLWSPVIEGKADLGAFAMPFGVNLELQPVNTPRGSLILFGGPLFGFGSLTYTTPYHAKWGVTDAASTHFQARATAFTGGLLLGMQGAVNAGQVKFVPFMMAATQSGSASYSFDHGYSGVRSLVTSGVVDIEPFTTTSIGMDIIIIPWNLSIGTMVQQLSSTDNQEGVKTTFLQLSWHFRK